LLCNRLQKIKINLTQKYSRETSASDSPSETSQVRMASGTFSSGSGCPPAGHLRHLYGQALENENGKFFRNYFTFNFLQIRMIVHWSTHYNYLFI